MVCKGGFFLNNNEACTYKEGQLPACAPLSVPFVPMQDASEPAYESGDALANGTLFPGLNLPFMDFIAKSGAPNTPLAELMALDFVTHELELYLNTHQDDAEAFETWKRFTALAAEGRTRYAARYGPVTQQDAPNCPSWTWVNDPWPWDGAQMGGNS